MSFDTANIIETFRDLMADKKPVEARAVLQEALDQNPADAKLHYQMSRFHEEEIRQINFWETAAIKTKRVEVLKRCMDAAKLDPTSHFYQYSVAVTARKLGMKSGKGFIQQAIRLNPTEPKYWREFGKQCTAAGEHLEAEKHFRRALEMNQNDHVSWFDFATSQIALGRAKMAKFSLENAQKLLAGKDRDFDRRITETLRAVYKMPPEPRDSRRIPAGVPSSPVYG